MHDIKARFVKIVNTTTGNELNPADVEVRNLKPNTNADLKRNTECFLMAMENGTLKGGMKFYYNRLDLAKIFRDHMPVIEMEYGTRTTTREIATALAERYGLDLFPTDVEPSGEFYLSAFPYDIKLISTAGNYCVTGEVTVRIVDAGAQLSTVMGVTSLSGLNPPNGNLDGKIQGALYSWNWKAQPQLAELLHGVSVGAVVPATILPYLGQLSGETWVDSATPAEFNMHGAKLVYSGQRDDHPYYSSLGRSEYLFVIELTDAATNIGGQLLFAVE